MALVTCSTSPGVYCINKCEFPKRVGKSTARSLAQRAGRTDSTLPHHRPQQQKTAIMAGPDRETSVSSSVLKGCGDFMIVLATIVFLDDLLLTHTLLSAFADDVCPRTGVHGQACRAG